MPLFLLQAAINFQDAASNDTLVGSGTTFAEWIVRIFEGLLAIAALMVLIYLIWGAISWITSGGDSSKVQKARDMMTQAVIGLIVLVATTAIFMLVQRALGIEVINFGSPAFDQSEFQGRLTPQTQRFTPTGDRITPGKN